EVRARRARRPGRRQWRPVQPARAVRWLQAVGQRARARQVRSRGVPRGQEHPALRVFLGTDHAAYETKEELKTWLAEQGHEPVDCGALTYDPDDDYPGFCADAARRAVAEQGSVAIVLGGSGNGEQMAANKVAGARAALCWSVE